MIDFWQISDLNHPALPALRTQGEFYAGQPEHHLCHGFLDFLRQLCLWINQFSQKRDSLLFVSMRQEAELTDLHEVF